MPGIKRPPKVFDYEEIKNLILCIPDATDRFILAIAYANGTRVGELKGLQAKDIVWDNDFVYITTPVLKKRGLVVPKRNPPISRFGEEWLANLIISYVEHLKPDTNLVPFCKRTLQYRFQQYADCTAHSFRHTRAMHMLRYFKMSMEKIRLFFRLSPTGLVSWIARYGHLDTEDLKQHYRDLGMVKK